MKTLIAITCYKCAPQIERVLRDLAQASFFTTVDKTILIDNQSPDTTAQTIQNFLQVKKLPRVELWINDENYGLGGTQKIAFQHAIDTKADCLVVLHGDDQALIDDVPRLLAKLESDPDLAAVLGSRFLPESKLIGYQRSRILGNRMLNGLFTLVTQHPTHDLGSGLNVFRVAKIKDLPIAQLSDGFTFNVDLLLQFYKLARKIEFAPITWKESDQVSNARNFAVARKMFQRLLLWPALNLGDSPRQIGHSKIQR